MTPRLATALRALALVLVALVAGWGGSHLHQAAAPKLGAFGPGAPGFTQGPTYLSSPPTLSNGQTSPPLVDSSGNAKVAEQLAPQAEDNTNAVIGIAVKPLATNTYAPSLFTNFGANQTLNVKASAGNVFSVWCSNANAAVRYIQLHNTATTPAGGAVPQLSYAIPALTGQTIIGADTLTFNGAYFPAGIAFAVSTTLATYTAATAADHNTQVMFK